MSHPHAQVDCVPSVTGRWNLLPVGALPDGWPVDTSIHHIQSKYSPDNDNGQGRTQHCSASAHSSSLLAPSIAAYERPCRVQAQFLTCLFNSVACSGLTSIKTWPVQFTICFERLATCSQLCMACQSFGLLQRRVLQTLLAVTTLIPWCQVYGCLDAA